MSLEKHSSATELKFTAAQIAANVLEPHAASVDREARWPEAGMRALADSGLTGLHIPRRFGGQGRVCWRWRW
jgi:isovaleryl-CoA dehydrogenase